MGIKNGDFMDMVLGGSSHESWVTNPGYFNGISGGKLSTQKTGVN